jgi:hypothetical protein
MFNIQAEVTFRLCCGKENLPKLWLFNSQSFFGSCVAFMKHNQDLRTDYDFTNNVSGFSIKQAEEPFSLIVISSKPNI